MSFAASQARLMMLISQQYDIELQMQFILQHKAYLGRAVQGMLNLKVDHEPGSQPDKILQARIHQLNEAEKVLEVRLESLRKRLDAVGQEREGLSKMISENAKKTFGIWGQ